MRGIKFRAWLDGEMHSHEDLVDMDQETHAVYTIITHKEQEEGDAFMQYTGLKDKNGREIYEGDIYHQGDPNITYTVVWHDTGLIGKQNGSSSYAGLGYWQDRIEVIGNVFEHTHLIE